MRRLTLVLCVIAAAACNRQDGGAIAFPEAVTGDWKRTAGPLEAEIPSSVAELGVRKAARAEYSGASAVEVVVYWMTNSTVAFEAFQKWAPAENSVSAHRGSCLLVARSAAGRQAAIAFLRHFEVGFRCP
jgi:hypothetical protein